MVLKKGYKALLDEALAQIETVPTAQAIAAHGDPDVVFVDLRDPRELQGGRSNRNPNEPRHECAAQLERGHRVWKGLAETFTQFITAW